MLNVNETKAGLYDLLSKLHEYEACEILEGSIDEKFRQKRMEDAAWNFRKSLQRLSVKVQNKSNARVLAKTVKSFPNS